MDTRFAIGRVFVVSVMGAYFLLEILSTEGGDTARFGARASPHPLVLGLQASIRGPRQPDLVAKMRANLEGTLEGIKEKVAQQEARRLATLEHEEQARLERVKGEGRRGRGGGPAAQPGSPQLASM